ncbi:hypothetical protein GCM10010406_22210 [Streptomyces thermolineatus]|uniref:WXG100 family type VII secretion target n=1 Tax=Streptomyces thermolineatus TaxID=44033 RepID=A0ABP5YSW6_9ACTN
MSTPFDGPQSNETTRMRLNSAADQGGGGGGAAGTTKADTARMNQASNALVELRGDTENVDNAADDDTQSAVRGLNKHTAGGMPDAGSWQTAGSLMTMDVRWGMQVANLKSMLQGISDKLHATTGQYTRAEQEERARMNAINSPFG